MGYALAVPFTSSSDRLAAYFTKRNNGIREAEMRLGVMLPASTVSHRPFPLIWHKTFSPVLHTVACICNPLTEIKSFSSGSVNIMLICYSANWAGWYYLIRNHGRKKSALGTLFRWGCSFILCCLLLLLLYIGLRGGLLPFKHLRDVDSHESWQTVRILSLSSTRLANVHAYCDLAYPENPKNE